MEIRDYVLLCVAVNFYLHLNFQGYIEWAEGNRNAFFGFVSDVFSYVSSNVGFIMFSAAVIACYVAIHVVSNKLANLK